MVRRSGSAGDDVGQRAACGAFGWAAKLPRYDRIPAALIGRLARDERLRGEGIGELLVADAVRRVLSAAEEIAVFAIVVEAKDETASRFYHSLGFLSFPDKQRRLFMLTSTAVAAAKQAFGRQP